MHNLRSFALAWIALLLTSASLACGPSFGGAGTPALTATVPGILGSPPTPVLTSAPPIVAACDLHLLKGGATWKDDAGALAGTIRLTNPGAAPCRLSGLAQLTLRGKDGQPLAVQPASQPADLLLPSGQTAQAAFLWSNFCSPTSDPGPTLTLSLPDPTSQLQLTPLDPTGAPLTTLPRCDIPTAPSTLELEPFAIQ